MQKPNSHTKLTGSFYNRSANLVAPDLLGKILVYRNRSIYISARLVETEAYLGSNDPASHAFRGMTPRNQVMFGASGHLYIYFTYGMHYCMNVVTGSIGEGEAVLLRAAEPLQGIGLMQTRRHTTDLVKLSSGPAKLVQAFGLNLSDNGADLMGSHLWIENDGFKPQIAVSARVGISQGRDLPLRFYIPGNQFVSKPNKNRYSRE